MNIYSSLFLLCFLVGSVLLQCNGEEYKVTDTKSGPIKGIKLQTKYEEKNYYAYRGIPYAKPPLGPLRFKAPERHGGWSKPLEAFKFGSNCAQLIITGATDSNYVYVGQEDCLFLNVYTPVDAKDLPVMFFIHGGGFMEGSGDDFIYGPDFLINENVILVTINYRLGAAGFLSLGTAEYSGNMGLKDQVLALKWVNENINQFGGDPKKITIFGQSAGGGSTHLLTLSPQTRGLYQRAIPMSGCAFNPWAIGTPKENVLIMFSLGIELGKKVNDYPSLLSFINNIDIKKLVSKTTKGYSNVIKNGKFELDLFFAPVVEVADAKDPIFTKDPVEYIYDNFRDNIDMMFGHTTAESLFVMGDVFETPDILKEFNEKFITTLPDRHLQVHSYNITPHVKARQAIREHYFGNEEINRDQINRIVDFASDIIFRYGIEKSLEFEVKRNGKTYYYTYNGDGVLNAFTKLFNVGNLGEKRANHGDELCYLFRCNIFNELYDTISSDSNEMKMIKFISSTFASFAKTGTPKTANSNVEWIPVTKYKRNIVIMESDRFLDSINILNDMTAFWDKVLTQYRQDMLVEMNSKDEL